MNGPTSRGAWPLVLLVVAAVATPLLAFWNPDQDPRPGEWARHIEKACTARRFALRVAAARKVADGGDDAVPALRAYAGEHGRNALPVTLVEAIAVEGAKSDKAGDATRELLLEWADDVDFYWRASAMRGLAMRVEDASTVSEADGARLVAPFAKYVDDRAWLMRTHARLGIAVLDVAGRGRKQVLALPEPDPRARVRLTRLLLEQDIVPPLQPLFDALRDERSFLGTPWGARLGQEANGALRRWLGDDYPQPDPDDKRGSIVALAKAAQQRSGQTIELPKPQLDPALDIVGGIEVLSCKHGDVFVQWTEAGELRFGIDGDESTTLAADDWRELQQRRDAIALDANVGVVVCDSMRIRVLATDTHAKVAPASLPEPAAAWLKQLADKLDQTGEASIAADLRRALGQFVGR